MKLQSPYINTYFIASYAVYKTTCMNIVIDSPVSYTISATFSYVR